MSANDKLIHVVDDDDAVRHSVAFLLRHAGYRVEAHVSGVAFLEAAKTLERGCVLLDMRMPEMNGIEVQEAMRTRGMDMPVIVLTGHGDIATAVQAMRAGAIHFLEKPYEKAELLSAIEEGCARLRQREERHMLASEAQAMLTRLTPRERDVLSGLIAGHPNKTIAFDLGISPRTVEIYRANLMEKLNVRSLSEVLRIAFLAETLPPAKPG